MDKQFKSVQEMMKWLEEEAGHDQYEGKVILAAKYREIIIALDDLSIRMEGDLLDAIFSGDNEQIEHVQKMFKKYYGP